MDEFLYKVKGVREGGQKFYKTEAGIDFKICPISEQMGNLI